MDKKTKNRIKKIAADILVSPLTALAASKEMVKSFNETENGQKTMETLKKTTREVSRAVKTASGKNKPEKAMGSVKEVAGKIGGVFTGGVGKVNEFLHEQDSDQKPTQNPDASGQNAENNRIISKNSGKKSSDLQENEENSNCSE